MPTRDSKTVTTVRIEDSVYNELADIAKTEVRSINNLIEYVLTKYVQHYQPREEFQTEQHSETDP